MPLFTDPMGKQMLAGARDHAVARRAGDPQDRQHQGVSRVHCRSNPDRCLTRHADGQAWNSNMLAQNLFTLDRWLPLAIFGLFAAVAWWLLDFLGRPKPRADERLDEFSNPERPPPRRKRQEPKKGDAMTQDAGQGHARLGQAVAAQDRAGSQASSRPSCRWPASAATPPPSMFLGLKFIGWCVGLLIGGGGDARHVGHRRKRR